MFSRAILRHGVLETCRCDHRPKYDDTKNYGEADPRGLVLGTLSLECVIVQRGHCIGKIRPSVGVRLHHRSGVDR
jgi:hypothetical protein